MAIIKNPTITITSTPPAPVAGEAAVTFIDYDGEQISTLTYDEAASLTSLPAGPTHAGLTFTGWNYTLAEINALTSPNTIIAGALYHDTASNGETTRLHIKPVSGQAVTLNFSQTVDGGVTIDWGDGSASETVSGTGVVNSSTHTYADQADLYISLTPAAGCNMALGGNDKNVFNSPANAANYLVDAVIGRTDLNDRALQSCQFLTTVTLTNSVTKIGSNSIGSCYGLRGLVIPRTVTTIMSYGITNAAAMQAISIPTTVTTIQAYAFQYSSIRKISAPGVRTILQYAFAYSSSLTDVEIPLADNNIYNYAFYSCNVLKNILMPTYMGNGTDSTFYGCRCLKSITIPNGMTPGNNIFANCSSLTEIIWRQRSSMPTYAFMKTDCVFERWDFTSFTAVPTLSSTNLFSNLPTYTKIVVPDALYNDWIVATNWSQKASQIIKASEE